MTISLEDLKKELLWFFKKNPKADNKIIISADFFNEVHDPVENKKFLSVKYSQGQLFAEFYDDSKPTLLTESLLQTKYKHLLPIYDQLRRRRHEQKSQQRAFYALFFSIGIGFLIAAGLIINSLMTGGLSLIAAGTALSSGSIGLVATYMGTQLLNWLESQLPNSKNIAPKDESIYQFKEPPKTLIQRILTPFSIINRILKNVAKFLILDNFISRWTVGKIIASIANSTNPHYQIEALTIAQTLGPLIFPAGLSKINFKKDGLVVIGPTISKQFHSLKYFNEIDDENELMVKRSKFEIQLNPEVRLEGMEVETNAFEMQPVTNQRYIIYFNGNSECYQAEYQLARDDVFAYQNEGVGVKAILFNYPRVMGSLDRRISRLSAQDLVRAGIAQVERLHDQGISYHQITLDGVSLGGSIASHVAGYYLQKGIHLNMTYVAKTFSSTTNVALSYINKLPVVGSILKLLLRPVIAFGLWGSDWQLDTAKHFASLPLNERHYTVVRSKKWVRENYQTVDDLVITHYASLHNSWRLRFERWCHKNGLFGFDPNTYKSVNSSHKMSVFDKPELGNYLIPMPKLCGHVGAGANHHGRGLMLLHRVGNELAHEKHRVVYPKNDLNQEVVISMGVESGIKKRETISDTKINRNRMFWYKARQEPENVGLARVLTSIVP